ncbi:bacterio-opsin activator domain-containing protein [Natronococcus sp. A-GB1]|uniref:bacterio-opsin activator domain-containing protein n=1 Tax=Natronococcus sp. A-GB1 TaxID=3037648 RepID=UPI00241CAEF8|nr:bacterio-opsin activator domain-containing protein [Natronococcus sp. A-GB1]MDG5760289.1 bacterio-opsin activator domain-containing protein [Natronococcus sp. A-GB1]
MTEPPTDDHRGEPFLEPIEVLLVDDNERWATFMADELEGRDPSFRVELALGANEALSVLRGADHDCLVVDYRMPEADGIQLVERVRERRPELPIILVTGEGSETIATRAIDAGVTDYLPKDPKVDQTPVLAGKIKSAVERRALRQAIEDSERRYRTVIEQSRDAIVILRDDRILFCNERFAELTDSNVDDLVDTSFVDAFVHEADRERFRGIDREILTEGIHRFRLVTGEGTIAHCEYTGCELVYDGAPATMLSIRDVTTKRLKEVRHRRERNLNRHLQRALVASRNREDLEDAVVTELARQGYDLVWFGTVVDARLQPRAVAGDRMYVEDVELSLERAEHECEPSVWAARTGTTQVIPDLETLFPTGWRELALERGFRTAIALPVGYDDVTYGVLAAYRAVPDTIDDAEHEFLRDLAATVGYAIHHMDARKALTADHGVEARIELRDGSHYLSEIVAVVGAESSEPELVVHSTYSSGDGEVVQYVSVRGGSTEDFRDAAADHPAVREAVPVRRAEADSFRLTVDGPTPESALAPFNARIRSTQVTADCAVLRIELPSRENLGALIDRLEDRYGHVSVLSAAERDWTDYDGAPAIQTSELTEKQAVALEAAYRHGYFEQPRRSSATDIATSLGISHSTYLQHLRAAQQKVFAAFYDE